MEETDLVEARIHAAQAKEDTVALYKKHAAITGYKFCELESHGCLNQFQPTPWHKKYCSKEHQQAKYRGR